MSLCFVCDPHQTPAHVLNSPCFPLCVRVNNNIPRPAQRDELREIFNDISSSSEDEEDEVDRHEDEDLNIMDTEDDLVRQLQDKLNESDSAQHESDRNNQIGERISGLLHPSRKCMFFLIVDFIKSLWN